MKLKRFFDVSFSLILLVLILPLLSFVAVVVLWKMGTPILFIQPRPGLKGKLFNLVKFRTMANQTSNKTASDEERLTRTGLLLRRYSLDELPELFNILVGDMSFVGPRPLLKEYLPLYNEQQNRRHEVKPGLTGWAQVNGRNNLSWEKKFEYDLWYVENQSFLLDLKILFMTIFKVLSSEGISKKGEATMSPFKGNVK